VKRGTVALGVGVLALAGAGAGLWWRAESARAKAPPPAATVVAKRRTFSATVAAVGAVKPQIGAEVKVGARVSGRVVKLHANIRDVVKKGQVLAELERAEVDAFVAQSQAELRVAEARLDTVRNVGPREIERLEAEVNRWTATEALARKDLARQDDLLKKQFIPQQTRDQAEERLLVAEAQLAAARKALELARTQHQEQAKQASAEIKRAGAAVASARAQRGYTLITAPISGVIGSVSTQEGETIAAGLNAPTFLTIVDLARLQVDAYVDEVDIGKVRIGGRVLFTVDAFPADEFHGTVMAIYPKAVVQDNVVKYVVAVEITTPYEGRLRPDMTASVTILLDPREALAIPAKAVRRERGRPTVHVRAGGEAVPREVKVGWKDGPWVEVASGLAEGDEVYVEPPPAVAGAAPGS
jgi:multidrug efflux pump subunit AcrA (membrane-fusion protein)